MRKAITLAVAVGALAFAGCGSDESREDADDVGNGKIDKIAPQVSAFNNNFPNVQHKCLYERADGNPRGRGLGLRAILTSGGHGSRIVVIPDPHCPGYVREQAGSTALGGNAP